MKTMKIHSPFDCHNHGSPRRRFRPLSRKLHLAELTFPSSALLREKPSRPKTAPAKS